MKLNKEEVGIICKRIMDRFISEGVVEIKAKKADALKKMSELFIEELMVENRLNEKVLKIMEQYKKEIEKGKIDYQKMFEMIKKQLIKERGLIL